VTKDKPICSLSLDLDNQWSYMKTHGDPGWEDFPSYLDIVVPRACEIFKRWDWTITFFVVGQDAALDKNREALGLITPSGHEVGNHSFHHEPWLHMQTRQQTEEEIARAEDSIEAATGVHTRGFRGPGYSFSRTTLEVLLQSNYLYDASTFPTFLGPLARAYYFLTSDFSEDEKQKRKNLFGGLRDGLRPVRPYLWDLGDEDLLEIPVTTMPLFKLPFHFSYLLYISTFSVALSLLYFKTALGLCRMTGTEPSLLLHPLDFLGGDDVSELAFFPAMKLESHRKLNLLDRFLGVLSSRYSVITVGEHARELQRTSLPKKLAPGDA